MSSKIALLLFFYSTALVAGYEANMYACQSAPQCVSQYLVNLGIATPPYPSYVAIIGKKQQFLGNGASGLDQLCSWNSNFQRCMSQDPQCLQGNSSSYLADKLRIARQEAELYVMYFAENVYECTDGRNDLLDNLQCFKNHHNQSLQVINRCRLAFDSDISRKCELTASLTECLRDGFGQECGKGTGEFMCNEEKVALRMLLVLASMLVPLAFYTLRKGAAGFRHPLLVTYRYGSPRWKVELRLDR
ncbi:hypothetical protein QR680_005654 [Steinernema hermaphroditum]|uniref:DUF19 domain-containing protein n=1 Tax=Steinernema hermaphroditum TaxID=289476 RepID=A0AA39HV98_9BILA|nr:hypothetical protein QR680_005654 [Steinernema hermaphroditum]